MLDNDQYVMETDILSLSRCIFSDAAHREVMKETNSTGLHPSPVTTER